VRIQVSLLFPGLQICPTVSVIALRKRQAFSVAARRPPPSGAGPASPKSRFLSCMIANHQLALLVTCSFFLDRPKLIFFEDLTDRVPPSDESSCPGFCLVPSAFFLQPSAASRLRFLLNVFPCAASRSFPSKENV